ncbi:MAG: peptidoglycan-binding protein LysM [Gammaproteobacteria bacterium]|nr:MAG: peptidoglycan-binding protein LysM [Gammaproteobacteria bacterium]RTZ59010.1 MAG: peptidoglycan-binding protein LysM [Gammaproteobacteria bacterium]
MGLFDFASNLGRKLFGKDDDPAAKIQKHIEEDNPGIEDLKVAFEDGVVKIEGKADDPAALEKAVLMAGNVKGVEKVVAEVEAPPIEETTEYYVIEKGDTLWAIASKYYGSGAKYTLIVDANKEVIKNADKIFPGQKIRIPKLED